MVHLPSFFYRSSLYTLLALVLARAVPNVGLGLQNKIGHHNTVLQLPVVYINTKNKPQNISELRSCVKVEVAVLGSRP